MTEMVRDICRVIPKMMRVMNKTKDRKAIASVAFVSLQTGNEAALISFEVRSVRKAG